MRTEANQVLATDPALKELLGKRCWMRYPFLQEALVHAISDAQQRVRGTFAMNVYNESSVQQVLIS